MIMCFRYLCVLLVMGMNIHAQNVDADELITLQYQELTLLASLNAERQNIKGHRVFLILHGTLAHRNMEIMTQLRAVLADNDEIALAPTLSLGIDKREGMYPCSVDHRHRHDDAVGELEAWREWLDQQGAETVVLIGHSRGANQVAHYMAQMKSNNISAAVLIAPPNHAAAKTKPDSICPGKVDDDLITVPEFLHCRDTKVSVSTWKSYSRPSTRKTSDSLKAINKPVLIVLGSDDQVVKATEWESPTLSGDAVTTLIIDGADHFFRDLYADELVESALDWLAE